jgi:hypothetical protein
MFSWKSHGKTVSCCYALAKRLRKLVIVTCRVMSAYSDSLHDNHPVHQSAQELPLTYMACGLNDKNQPNQGFSERIGNSIKLADTRRLPANFVNLLTLLTDKLIISHSHHLFFYHPYHATVGLDNLAYLTRLSWVNFATDTFLMLRWQMRDVS